MLKPISHNSTATVVWAEDPAINQKDSKIDLYVKNVAKDPSCWNEHLKMDGVPTKFTIGVIPPSQLTQFEGICNYGKPNEHRNSLNLLCFYRGLTDISDFPPEWLFDTKEVPKTDPGGGLAKHVSSAWLERYFVRDNRQCALFIGGIIWAWNQYSEDDGKN